MTKEVVFRNVLVGAAVFSCGVLIYLAQIRAAQWRQRRDVIDAGYVALFLGVPMIVIPVVQSIILQLPAIPITWQGIMYAAGLLLTGAGGVIVAINVRKRNRSDR